MAKGHKPVAGSRAFWPKKRAKRIHPKMGSLPEGKGLLGFAGYKAGMTQVSVVNVRKGSPRHGKEVFLPATVLAVPPLVVAGIKAYKKTSEGLRDTGIVWADSISKDLPRKTSTPKKTKKSLEGDEFRLVVHTKPREATGKKKPDLFELPVKGGWDEAKAFLGKELKANEIFKEGEFIDVRAVSTGKGFQGPVKRFGVTIRNRKAKKKRRHVGVMGPRGVARILPNSVAMAGQMGFQTRTEYNKQILKFGESLTPKGGWTHFGQLKGSYLIVSGSVPGPKKRLIMLRKGIRAKREEKLEIKHISLESQQ
ncbi:MAG: 50S ribosomal protein L3 [Candidatus Aenigmarchaeota archaeon]|nr:50S ribosomal protein L3 [Candidatus Aenigmarchaeota archaeon]